MILCKIVQNLFSFFGVPVKTQPAFAPGPHARPNHACCKDHNSASIRPQNETASDKAPSARDL